MLVNDGFIIRHQGKGSIVQGQPKGIGILSLSGTTSAIGEDKLTTHIIVKPKSEAGNRHLAMRSVRMTKVWDVSIWNA